MSTLASIYYQDPGEHPNGQGIHLAWDWEGIGKPNSLWLNVTQGPFEMRLRVTKELAEAFAKAAKEMA